MKVKCKNCKWKHELEHCRVIGVYNIYTGLWDNIQPRDVNRDGNCIYHEPTFASKIKNLL